MPNWRELDERLDRTVVRAFDYGDVAFQAMDGEDPVGDPWPLPAEFDSAHVSIDIQDGNQVSTTGPVLMIHFADLPIGAEVETEDRFIIGSGRAAGTYVVDEVQVNEGRTGATIKLKKL